MGSQDGLMEEFTRIKTDFNKFIKDLERAPQDVKDIFNDHILNGEELVRALEQKLEKLEESRVVLAQYFCEDTAKFKVHDAIETFNTLCLKIADARKENNLRQKKEAQQKLREEAIQK